MTLKQHSGLAFICHNLRPPFFASESLWVSASNFWPQLAFKSRWTDFQVQNSRATFQNLNVKQIAEGQEYTCASVGDPSRSKVTGCISHSSMNGISNDQPIQEGICDLLFSSTALAVFPDKRNKSCIEWSFFAIRARRKLIGTYTSQTSIFRGKQASFCYFSPNSQTECRMKIFIFSSALLLPRKQTRKYLL